MAVRVTFLARVVRQLFSIRSPRELFVSLIPLNGLKILASEIKALAVIK